MINTNCETYWPRLIVKSNSSLADQKARDKESSMAVPVVIVIGMLARAATQVLTKPHVWVFLFGWIALSKFDFGVFSREVRETVAGLWWLVILILITLIIMTAIKAYAPDRRPRR